MTDLPATMRAIAVSEPGDADKLTVTTIDVPAPADGEVLIKVAAAGLNRADIMQRRGLYPAPPGVSDILGLEISGTVAKIGKGVTEWQIGDQVCALLAGGGYAEYCVSAAETCLPIPKGVDLVAAAGLPETYATVWSNVFDRVGLQPGETFLVHGGTSGIGTTAIMLAKTFGSKVFATAGSDDKCKVCEQLGADIAINYKTQDFVDVVKANTDKGVNVILDMVGGDYIARNIKALAPDGRMVNIAYQNGSKAEVDFMPVLLKRLTITGSTLRVREIPFKKAIMDNLTEKVWPRIEDKTLQVVTDSTFPLERAADAHKRMEASGHIGKILLTMEN